MKRQSSAEKAGGAIGRTLAAFLAAWVFSRWGWTGIVWLVSLEVLYAVYHLGKLARS